MEDLDVVVVGAGVVGLAVASTLARSGRGVVVVDREQAIGMHSSSRNSEVVHAGIYYPTGSLKARLCVQGRDLLYTYCERHGVAFHRLGKIIIAVTEDELPVLRSYKAQAEANGVNDLVWLGAEEIRALEPSVRAVGGLLSPSTGIVDSHALMLAYRAEIESFGGQLCLSTPVIAGRVEAQRIVLHVAGTQPTVVGCRALVNAAGLFAQDVAKSIIGLPPTTIPAQYFAKGHYFVLRGKSPFSRLVYPVAVSGGLGVHVTLDMAGQARFGPDVCWIDSVSYVFDERRITIFCEAIRRYYPNLPDDALQPGYTGIRPKLSPQDGGNTDFVIQSSDTHGVRGLVNLFGIESPGLTASLAIAREVAMRLEG